MFQRAARRYGNPGQHRRRQFLLPVDALHPQSPANRQYADVGLSACEGIAPVVRIGRLSLHLIAMNGLMLASTTRRTYPPHRQQSQSSEPHSYPLPHNVQENTHCILSIRRFTTRRHGSTDRGSTKGTHRQKSSFPDKNQPLKRILMERPGHTSQVKCVASNPKSFYPKFGIHAFLTRQPSQ